MKSQWGWSIWKKGELRGLLGMAFLAWIPIKAADKFEQGCLVT